MSEMTTLELIPLGDDRALVLMQDVDEDPMWWLNFDGDAGLGLVLSCKQDRAEALTECAAILREDAKRIEAAMEKPEGAQR